MDPMVFFILKGVEQAEFPAICFASLRLFFFFPLSEDIDEREFSNRDKTDGQGPCVVTSLCSITCCSRKKGDGECTLYCIKHTIMYYMNDA